MRNKYKWLKHETWTSLTFIEDLLLYHTVYASSHLEFVEPASAGLKFSNSSTRSRHFLCEIRMQQPCFFPKLLPPKHYLPLTCLLIHTNNNFSTSSIVCDLCFVSKFTPFCNISFLDFFFLHQDGTDHWCRFSVHPGEFGHAYGTFVLCYEFFCEFYSVSRLLCQSAGTRNFLWPHGGAWDALCGHSIPGNEWPSHTGRQVEFA